MMSSAIPRSGWLVAKKTTPITTAISATSPLSMASWRDERVGMATPYEPVGQQRRDNVCAWQGSPSRGWQIAGPFRSDRRPGLSADTAGQPGVEQAERDPDAAGDGRAVPVGGNAVEHVAGVEQYLATAAGAAPVRRRNRAQRPPSSAA